MKLLRGLLGPLSALETIRPPGSSFEDCERFLEDARAAGVASLAADRDGVSRAEFGTPLGMALLRLYRWMKDARANGLTYDQAKRAWAASFEREAAALQESARQTDARRVKAASERNGPARGKARYGLQGEMHALADEAGLD